MFDSQLSGGMSSSGVAYFWDFADGSRSTLRSPSHTFQNAGTFNVRVSATDATGTVEQELTVTVLPPENEAPSVEAGADLSVSVHQVLELSGSVEDDGLPSPPAFVATQWRLRQGPGEVVFSDDMSARSTATFDTVGTYLLELVANDGDLVSVDTLQVTVEPDGVEEFMVDDNTVALYHFDQDFTDSTSARFDLLAAGNTRVVAENQTWMQQPSGGVARFEALGDTLQVSLPDSKILPEAGAEFSIEFRLYVRSYLAWGVANREVVGLRQHWDTSFSIHDRRWAYPRNPNVISCNQEVVTSAVWEQKVAPLAWNAVKLTFDGSVVKLWVNGELVGTRDVVPNFDRNQEWTLLIGNFDGDIDEFRVSNVVR